VCSQQQQKTKKQDTADESDDDNNHSNSGRMLTRMVRTMAWHLQRRVTAWAETERRREQQGRQRDEQRDVDGQVLEQAQRSAAVALVFPYQ
jgi:hypothetical protein